MTTLAGQTSSGKRSPDFENLRRTLLRQGPPGPVPFIELGADPATMESVLGEKFPVDLPALVARLSTGKLTADDLLNAKQVIDMIVRFWYETGHDYVPMFPGLEFGRNYLPVDDTADTKNWESGQRFWQDENSGPIQTWEDFERYPWPKPEEINYAAIEYLNATIPEGMKVCVTGSGGVVESTVWLMGLQPFAYALYDRPDLVQAIVDKVGELILTSVKTSLTYDNVGMVFQGDDMGYSGGTMISPVALRKYFFPYHRRLVEAAHAAGKPIVLHSCGNLEKIMDDIIDMGFDAKHSFEDKIMTVEDVYQRWGERIAVAGGVDMDILGRGSEEQVRRRTRQILEVCGVNGTGYCLGTGNTVANYIPRRNYLAMLDEGRRWNREHFGAA